MIRRSLSLLAVALMSAPPLVAQDAQSLPRVVQAMAGSWEGSGTLFGRAAGFTVEWTVGDHGFVHLAFSNGFAGEDGSVSPVLSAEATYLWRGEAATGVWIDTRPQRLTLDASIEGRSVVTRWVAEAETGRTQYELVDDETLRVRDWVHADGGERLFAEATYSRAGR